MPVSTTIDEASFITGGGEMGDLIRRHDWSATPLGIQETWPQSLRTTLSIILNSRFPMFLFWGPELTCFYNDAFRPSLGNNGKHPSILGGKGEDAWIEIWPVIQPLLDQVLSGGDAIWSEDQLIPIYRNGKIEDVYWTFSYSAVNDESGRPAGIFVTCSETTEKVINLEKLSVSRDELQFAIEATELGTFEFTPATGKFSANQRLKEWFGLYSAEEFDLEYALNAIIPEDRQKVTEAINEALDFNNGGKFEIMYTILHPETKKERIVHAKGKSWFNDRNEAYRFNGTLQDTTREYNARKTGVENELKLAESERHLKSIIIQAPFAIAIFRTENYLTEMVNDRSLELWGRKEQEVLGIPILEAMPELKNQGIKELLDHVFQTGEIFSAKELPVQLLRKERIETAYVNFSYEPLYDKDRKINGIMAIGVEVTDQVNSRKILEELNRDQKATGEKLNIIIDASELGTWELNLKTDKIEYSARYKEIFGFANDDIPSHEKMLQLLHPDDREIRDRAMQNAIDSGKLYYVSRIIWDDGSVHWIEVQGKVFYDGDFKPSTLVGTLRDITEARKHQQMLQESEQKFRLLADSMPQFVWTGDVHGNLNYFNKAVYDYSGLTKLAIDREGWLQIVHPEEQERNVAEWIKSIQSGADFIFEHRFRRHDGVYRWQLSRAIPQKDDQGKIQMWVGTSTDIEEQKTFAAVLESLVQERTGQLAQTNLELGNMNKELQSFAYVSSHDLQEPLRKIQTFSDRLLNTDLENLSEEGKTSLHRIVNAADRMRKLIDDLLAYSRISLGKQSFEPVVLKEVIEEVLVELGDSIREKNATIQLNGSVKLNVIRFQIVQLIQNLLSNALKFSAPDRRLEISITMEKMPAKAIAEQVLLGDGSYCHIRVVDNGIGFDPEYGDKIFELFQRLHENGRYSGTGVGLAIVKRIVENHDGEIHAIGKPGEGSVFNIYLPVN